MDIRKRLKEIEESLPGDLPDIKIAERYEKSVEKVGNVNRLLNTFEKIKNWKIINYSIFYEIASKKLNSINYSLKDIENLCPVIEGDEDKIGVYISAAINKIIKDGEEVRLNFRNRRIDFIGMNLSKGKIIVGDDAKNFVGYKMKGGSINIEGDVGDCVGYGMESGSINIKRSAGNGVGYEMKGGSINIEGDVRDYVGEKMEGGSIHIKGNVGDYVGNSSEGGEIRIEGNYKSIGENCKAKIYHKGKLIESYTKN